MELQFTKPELLWALSFLVKVHEETAKELEKETKSSLGEGFNLLKLFTEEESAQLKNLSVTQLMAVELALIQKLINPLEQALNSIMEDSTGRAR